MTEWSQESDEELIRRYVQDNDRSAFETLLSRHYQQTYRLALKMLGDPAGADDAAQNAFVSLLRKAYRFEQGRPFRPWFYAIVMNAIRQEGRKRQRRQVKEQDAAVSELVVQRNWDEPFIREEIEKTLCYLSEEDRVAVILHFYEGKTHSDIAADLGIPKGTVSTRIRRGLNRLKSVMSKSGYGGSILGIEEALRNWPHGGEGAVIPNAAALERRANSWLAQSIIVKATVVAVGAMLVSLAFAPDLLEPSDNADEKDSITVGWRGDSSSGKKRLDRVVDDQNGDPSNEKSSADDGETERSGGTESTRSEQGTSKVQGGQNGKTEREAGPEDSAQVQGPVRVRVLDSEGKAFAGARVSFVASDTVLGEPHFRNDGMRQGSSIGVTDANGELQLKLQKSRLAGRSVFRLYAQDKLFLGRTESLRVEDLRTIGEEGRSLTIRLKDPRKLAQGESALILTALKADEGSKPRRLKGTLRGLNDSSFRRAINRSMNEQGQTAIHELPPGSYRLTASLTGFATQSFDFLLKGGKATVQELSFRYKESIIRGSFAEFPEGKTGRQKAILYRLGERNLLGSRRSSRLGRFEFKGLAPGNYVVKVIHPEQTGLVDWQIARVERAGTIVQLKPVVFRSELAAQGVLVDQAGRPVPSKDLVLANKSLGVISRAKSSNLGQFEFRGVKPGRYSLVLSGKSKQILARVEISGQSPLFLGEVLLASEEQTRRFVVLMPSQEKGEIRCQLSAPGYLQTLNSTWRPSVYWVSKVPGLVYFQAQVGGAYYTPLMPLQLKGGQIKKLPVAQLLKAGQLSGRLIQFRGRGREDRVTLRRIGRGLPFASQEAIIGASGQFQFQNLAPGSYQLSVGHVSLAEAIVIPAGGQVTKKISLQGEDASLNVRWRGETPKDIKLSFFWLSQDRRAVGVIAGESVKKSLQTYKLKAGQIHAIYGRQSAGQFQGIVKKTTVFASQTSDLDLAWSESFGSSSLSGQVKGVKEGQRLCVFAVSERALYSREIGRDGAFQLNQLPSGQYRVFLGENPYVDWNDALLCSLSKGEKRALTGPIPRLTAVHGKD